METSQIKDQKLLHHYTCPGCGADQEFEPKNDCLSCAHCGRQEQIPTSDEQILEHSYKDYLHPRKQKSILLTQNGLEVNCTRCHASVIFTPPEVAGECSFCGAKIVVQAKSTNPLIAPEAILPFQITKDEAANNVQKWISSLWFAPNSLKQIARQRSIEGIYIPFWTYNAYTTSHYTGERGEHYYETKNYKERNSDGKMETKTHSVQKTKWRKAKGRVSRWFEDVLVAATTSLSRKYLDSLAPWDLKQLKPYDPAFLSGYKAQRYQIDLATGFETSKEVMEIAINQDINQDIGGDEQRIHKVSTTYSGITFKHILLPVYVVAYLFNQKSYQVLVNARTGHVQGDRPYSKWKFVLFTLASLVLLTILIIICIAIPIIPIIIIFLLVVGLIGWIIYSQFKQK